MNTDKVLTVLPNLAKKKNLFSLRRDHYTLVVTEQKLIFARLSKVLYKQQVEDVKAIIANNKKNKVGFLSSMVDRMTAYSNWFRRYYEMTIEDIISETSGNIVIDKADITALKIRQFLEANDESFQGKTRSPILTLKTKGIKYKYVFSGGFNPADLKVLKYWND